MHINTVNINIRPDGFGSAALAALLAFDSPSVKAQERRASKTPAVGTYWQGEGGIYVGVGRGYDGVADHHLILPTDPRAIFVKRALGTYGVDVKNADSDHNGMANTVALADAGSDLCKEILGLEIEGHKDFFLMARADARLCMANVPELFDKEWYLTSTQYSSYGAWLQTFSNGRTGTGGKEFEARARAVRRLIL